MKIGDILGSIVLVYFSAALIDGDNNTVLLASIFWLLAAIHYRNSKQISKKD